jgi:hypothetical protein
MGKCTLAGQKPDPTDGLDVVLTAEMIDAGVKALGQWTDAPVYLIAAAVYRAMAMAAPSGPRRYLRIPTALDILTLPSLRLPRN